VVRELYKTDTTSEGVKRRKRDGADIVFEHGEEIEFDGTYYHIPSSKPHIWYRVSVKHKACECPDNSKGGWLCKHYWAAMLIDLAVRLVKELKI
jgi:hypothetical protein